MSVSHVTAAARISPDPARACARAATPCKAMPEHRLSDHRAARCRKGVSMRGSGRLHRDNCRVVRFRAERQGCRASRSMSPGGNWYVPLRYCRRQRRRSPASICSKRTLRHRRIRLRARRRSASTRIASPRSSGSVTQSHLTGVKACEPRHAGGMISKGRYRRRVFMQAKHVMVSPVKTGNGGHDRPGARRVMLVAKTASVRCRSSVRQWKCHRHRERRRPHPPRRNRHAKAPLLVAFALHEQLCSLREEYAHTHARKVKDLMTHEVISVDAGYRAIRNRKTARVPSHQTRACAR
jgi:hypothetical protein